MKKTRKNAKWQWWRDFVSAVLAGFCIGLGGTVFLRLKDAFPGGNVVGAILFTVGLFTICTRGYNLFTGKACYPPDKKNKIPAYLLFLLIVWLGNLVGCLLIVGIEYLTTLVIGSGSISAVAGSLVDAKMNSSLLSLFGLGILCNILIFIAVDGFKKNPHELGKYLALFFGVVVFILCGMEHSIADMYYWGISGRLFTDFFPSILCILVISLGNIVGALFFGLVERLFSENKK